MKICLVGVTHPCHNPRLVREADTLVEAGHEVRVVAPSLMRELAEKDKRLLATRKWRLDSVDLVPLSWQGSYRSFVARGRRKVAYALFALTRSGGLAKYAYTTALSDLTMLACREKADWFIAHTQPALPIAEAAARRWGAQLGFDCEDLLAELGADPADLVRSIEQRYLPHCTYVSVSSHAVAERLVESYAISEPLVLYNVFPVRLAESLLPPTQRQQSDVLRLHWFGQTIGPGRGIEEAIHALQLVGPGAELHLRGWLAEGYAEVLSSLGAKCGVSGQVRFLPTLDHDQVISSMDAFDVGLALERPENEGYATTVTNKVFSYMLAGLAIAATDTPGQREILSQAPGLGFLYTAGNPELLAEGLRKWIDNRTALREAQTAAWQVARQRFCWDLEADKFLTVLGRGSTFSSATLRPAGLEVS